MNKLKFKLWMTWFVLSVIVFIGFLVKVSFNDAETINVNYYILVIINMLATILCGIFGRCD